MKKEKNHNKTIGFNKLTPKVYNYTIVKQSLMFIGYNNYNNKQNNKNNIFGTKHI